MFSTKAAGRGALLLVFLSIFAAASALPSQAQERTEHVFLITLDGLRWQELFTGADSLLIGDERFVDDAAALRSRFWGEAARTRRERLMPFFWNVIAREGQLYGNRQEGCSVQVANTHRFSYPGYNEILTGHADDARINSNAKRPNPNVTVLEHVNAQSGFRGRVAAFGSWDVFPYIINETRSGVPVNAGFEPAAEEELTDKEKMLNELQAQIPSPWGSVRLDAFTHHYAREYVRKHHPRLLYVAYGETDDFAHDADYQAYLEAAHRTDAFIRDLWTLAQNDPQYRGRTTFVITTDHGRGAGDAWTGHGSNVAGAEDIWIAVLGPDAAPLGEVTAACGYRQNQVAATVAALLGVAYDPAHTPGPPLRTVLGK